MGRGRLSVALLIGALLFVGVGSAQAAGPYPPPSSGSASVDPSRIKIGECATFSGDGFAPGSTVAIGDNGVPRGSVVADGNGAFSIELCYPSGSKRGRHELTGTGTGADGSPLSVMAVLFVEGVRQNATNPTTQAGGAVSGPEGPTSPGEQPVAGDGVVAAGPIPVATSNSGMKLLALGLGSLLFAFLASLFILLLARRRRREEEEDVFPQGAV